MNRTWRPIEWNNFLRMGWSEVEDIIKSTEWTQKDIDFVWEKDRSDFGLMVR